MWVRETAHRVGSIGAPSRTVFIRGTNTKQWEVSKLAGRNNNNNNKAVGNCRSETKGEAGHDKKTRSCSH
jgi:hypothetical protein